MEDVFEVIEAPTCELAAVFEGSGGLGLAQEVEREVFDDGHVFRPMPGPQAGKVVPEDDVEGPVQLVVSRPEELHLRPLVELCVRLSPHTAPIRRTRR